MQLDQRKNLHLGSISLQNSVLHCSCCLAVSLSSAKTVLFQHLMVKPVSQAVERMAWGYQMSQQRAVTTENPEPRSGRGCRRRSQGRLLSGDDSRAGSWRVKLGAEPGEDRRYSHPGERTWRRAPEAKREGNGGFQE